jgi:hypothetical protein
MTIQTFGIWIIDDEIGLIGYVDGDWEYIIGKYPLWDTRISGNIPLWEWMLHLSEKKWFTETVASDFNQAFAFAQDHFKHLKPKNLPYVSMEHSINAQKSYMQPNNSFTQLFTCDNDA